MTKNPTDFMTMALEQARNAAKAGEVPIGAVVVDGQTGAVLARAHNQQRTPPDPTGHAELIALREAARAKGTHYLVDCDVYVSLEPCAMCAAALAHAKVRRVVFAAYDPKGGAIDHGPRLYTQPTILHKPEVIGGVMESEGAALLTNFFQDVRTVKKL